MAHVTAPLAALALAALASPALADLTLAQEDELRGLGQSFLSAPAADAMSRLRSLAGEGRTGTASGTLSLGTFDRPLEPLAGAVTIATAPEYALACRTEITTDFAGQEVTRSRDRIEMRRGGDGGVAFRMTTDRAASRLAVVAQASAAGTRLARWLYSGPEGSMDVRPIGTTALYRDAVSREVLTPEAPDRRLIDQLLGAVVAGNPAWFIGPAEVRLGQPWLGSDSDEGALPRILALAGPLLGDGAGFDALDIVSTVSGRFRSVKRDGVVVEYAGRMGLAVPGATGPLGLSLTGYEVYDIETLARLESRFDLTVSGDGVNHRVEQTQLCAMN